MRRIHYALAFLSTAVLLAAVARGQEEPPPMPPTRQQLVRAERAVRRKLELASYRKNYHYHTVDELGSVTGSRSGAWRLLVVKGRPRVEELYDTGSSLKQGFRLTDGELRDFSRSLPVFFDGPCEVRFIRAEERAGRLLLRYHTTWTGEGRCFDGRVWVDPTTHRAVEAEGRDQPAHRFDSEGVEIIYPRGRVWMRPDGLPDRAECEDVLTFSLTQAYDRDKNGEIVPRRIRVRHEFRFSEWNWPRTSEPEVIEQGDVEDEP